MRFLLDTNVVSDTMKKAPTPKLLRRRVPGTWGKLLRLIVALPAIDTSPPPTKAVPPASTDLLMALDA